jgi:serine phosphatase RsbU (regulator of sigma subunit)
VYVIGRHRLLDFDFRIRRGVQYNLVSALWLATIGVTFALAIAALAAWNPVLPNIRLTGGSVEVVDVTSGHPEQGQMRGLVLMFGALLFSAVLWKTGKLGLTFIATRFHRTRYDYRKAAHELTEVMSTRLSMDSLAQGIVQKLAELMQLKRVGLVFFRGGKSCCCEEAYGFDGTVWREMCIRREAELAESIQRFHGEIRIDYLPAGVKEDLTILEFQYLVPIRSQETLVGAILVGEKRSESTFQREDLEFLGAAARQVSVAIENAFLYEELAGQERLKHELAIARRIQMESLPQSTPSLKGLDIDGISIPAMEVGGDYYDYLNGSSERLTVIIGDVSGKGTSAALYMSKIQGILRSLHGFGLTPRELFTRTNVLLWNDLEKKSFVTGSGAMFQPGKRQVLVARAWHLSLYWYRCERQIVEVVTTRGMGMGLSGNGAFAAELEERCITYAPGDVFLFVTDGITEGKNERGEEFAQENLVVLLRDSAFLTASGIRDRITEAVHAFTGTARQHDDQTVVVVKVA